MHGWWEVVVARMRRFHLLVYKMVSDFFGRKFYLLYLDIPLEWDDMQVKILNDGNDTEARK